MDPFEAQVTFLQLLRENNLSARIITKAATLAYANKDICEGKGTGNFIPSIQYKFVCFTPTNILGLFNSLLDTIRQVTPMKRLPLFYVIDALVKNSVKYHIDDYVKLIMQNLKGIIDLVVDIKKSGGTANIGSVRKVLTLWKGKDLIEAKVFKKMDGYLAGLQESIALLSGGTGSISKEQIWRRMEDDRDRQKRAREESWVRQHPSHITLDTTNNSPTAAESPFDDEFLDAWSKAIPPSPRDYALFKELEARFAQQI